LQHPANVNALLLQALLCVSHNAKITNPVLTGLGGCFEMLRNFGFHISGKIAPSHNRCHHCFETVAGASHASMTSSLRTAALALMSQRAPPTPKTSGGVFAVGIVNRSCVQIQAAMRCKLVCSKWSGLNDQTTAIAERLAALKQRASGGLVHAHHTTALAHQTAAASVAGSKPITAGAARDGHMSKPPVDDVPVEVTGVSDEQNSRQNDGHAAAGNTHGVGFAVAVSVEEQRKQKHALHQQVAQDSACGALRCCVLYFMFYILYFIFYILYFIFYILYFTFFIVYII
jgi:hypothetical protein